MSVYVVHSECSIGHDHADCDFWVLHVAAVKVRCSPSAALAAVVRSAPAGAHRLNSALFHCFPITIFDHPSIRGSMHCIKSAFLQPQHNIQEFARAPQYPNKG